MTLRHDLGGEELLLLREVRVGEELRPFGGRGFVEEVAKPSVSKRWASASPSSRSRYSVLAR
jgi:hypothetical protein